MHFKKHGKPVFHSPGVRDIMEMSNFEEENGKEHLSSVVNKLSIIPCVTDRSHAGWLLHRVFGDWWCSTTVWSLGEG